LWGSKVHLKGFEKCAGYVGQSVNAHATIRAGNWLLCKPCLPKTALKMQPVLLGHAPDFYRAIPGNL
jgi:hypothetical protein